ncbi:MAG: hypothetical protein L0H31_14220, partial [Nocardioidaceae bacterium]|nr:hypothetical protein [Nocardioidaceae bacterium]
LSNVPLLMPDRDTQLAIAEALGALDDKIAGNTQLRKTAESLLAALFGHTGMDTEPASEAEAVPLTDFVALNPRLPAPSEAEPIYVDMQKLPTTGMSITDWNRRAAKGGARFQNGDTLLARITPCLENGKTGYVDFLDEGQVGLGSTEYIVLRAGAGHHPGLAYFLARSPRLREYAIRHMVGSSGRQRLSAANLALLRLTKPDGDALRTFEDTAMALLPRLAAARDETRRLVETRDALLPQLMSGKLKVKDAERVVEGVV